jgi:hypothetical protein
VNESAMLAFTVIWGSCKKSTSKISIKILRIMGNARVLHCFIYVMLYLYKMKISTGGKYETPFIYDQ